MPPADSRTAGGPLPSGFHFGVATAGFQVEGGYNGPGQPANNWLAWEQAGRVEPSGNAVDFWDHHEIALDRAAALGCTSFRLGVEWARVFPEDTGPDQAALDRYRRIVDGCVDRGLEPLVTLHHFTHPAWLGEDFWLRPDAAARYRAWADVAVEALAPSVRHWVTINEVNVLIIGSWLLGMFPPGRSMGFDDVAVAADNLLSAHVAGYEVIHEARSDAVVTTNNSCISVYGYDRMLTDLLLARGAGVAPEELDGWIDERRRRHDGLLPPPGLSERSLRRLDARLSAYGSRARRRPGRLPRRAVDALYGSAYERTLDVLGVDYYDPLVARHFRLPGHRTAGGRNPLPTRELWDDVPDPAGLARWLADQHALAPDLPLWVVENGLCNRVRNGRAFSPRRRMGPESLSTREPGGGGRRHRRRHTGDRLLALVVGGQLRVGIVRAPLRPLRCGSPPRRTRYAVAGDRLDGGRLGDHLPGDHRRSHPG